MNETVSSFAKGIRDFFENLSVFPWDKYAEDRGSEDYTAAMRWQERPIWAVRVAKFLFWELPCNVANNISSALKNRGTVTVIAAASVVVAEIPKSATADAQRESGVGQTKWAETVSSARESAKMLR